jgi:hypothetical protein
VEVAAALLVHMIGSLESPPAETARSPKKNSRLALCARVTWVCTRDLNFFEKVKMKVQKLK